jgi:pseudouridine-5'-phosphate glycosidase
MKILSRVPEPAGGAVALETTLLVHGVPRDRGALLGRELAEIVRAEGAFPALIGVVEGRPTVGMTEDELSVLMGSEHVAKANTANLGVLMHRGEHAATTVSTTMELAALAGVRVFATGGIGGVHEGYGTRLDVSSDLAAFTRFPVAVVTSGVKSILDVESTREALESLGIPVIGFGTDRFPAFYLRESGAGVDARFEDAGKLAAYVDAEVARTGRGIVIANPILERDEIPPRVWTAWLSEARAESAGAGATGRDVTPKILASLHRISGGATLEANLSLIRSNAKLAGALATRLGRMSPR